MQPYDEQNYSLSPSHSLLEYLMNEVWNEDEKLNSKYGAWMIDDEMCIQFDYHLSNSILREKRAREQ